MRILLIFTVLLVISVVLLLAPAGTSSRNSFQQADENNPVGFIPVDCWFSADSDWPAVECFQMQVPEDFSNPAGRLITFPVAVFRSSNGSPNKAPLLHLGAGGPGAPMYLDSTPVVNDIWRSHDEMSIDIGRDLFVIDPRGTGLSHPLLSCKRFVDNELLRFKYNLSLEDEVAEVDADYYYCIDEFLSKGIDLAAYNSFSIANDIETMRIAAKINQWVLLGVSYGSNYAQTIANEFPDSVESMVLDSATFPRIKMHHDYIARTTAPYQKLFNYCDSDPACNEADGNMEQRIWTLFDALSDEPIQISIDHPFEDRSIPIALTGGRFLAALFEGIYGVEIFKELPQIIGELEIRQYERLKPYVLAYSDFMLDQSYGDVSATAHYCFEDRPFIDYDLMAKLTDDLPAGYIQDIARLSLSWPKYCERMKIDTAAPAIVLSEPTDIPTLFLQGKYDTVTPLSDVESNRHFFRRHELITFDLSHSILSSSTCAEKIAGKFIENHYLTKNQRDCN